MWFKKKKNEFIEKVSEGIVLGIVSYYKYGFCLNEIYRINEFIDVM